MNAYYHEFLPGFNFWYLFIIIAAFGAIMIGRYQWRADFERRRLVLQVPELLVAGYAVVCAMALMALLIVESGDGIIQVFDNCLDGHTSPVWSLVFAAGTIAMVSMGYGFLVFFLSEFESDRREKELRKLFPRRTQRRASKPQDWWRQ